MSLSLVGPFSCVLLFWPAVPSYGFEPFEFHAYRCDWSTLPFVACPAIGRLYPALILSPLGSMRVVVIGLPCRVPCYWPVACHAIGRLYRALSRALIDFMRNVVIGLYTLYRRPAIGEICQPSVEPFGFHAHCCDWSIPFIVRPAIGRIYQPWVGPFGFHASCCDWSIYPFSCALLLARIPQP